MSAHTYALRGPCHNCPFRNDRFFYLGADRARQIARSIRSGGSFSCHKTTEYRPIDDNGGEDMVATSASKFCGGALATLEREGQPNQIMRIADRLGLYDPTKLDPDAPVFDSLDEWLAQYDEDVPTVTDPETGETVPYDHCEVVAEDCEDPAGYAAGGGAYRSADPPTCNPLEDVCAGCGRMACASCRSDQWDDEIKLCVVCAADEDPED